MNKLPDIQHCVASGWIKFPPPPPVKVTFVTLYDHANGYGKGTTERFKAAQKRRAEWFAANPGATQADYRRAWRRDWERRNKP